MQRAQQRGLVVERLARVGYEDGGYAERVVHDEDRRRGVPCRVAPRLEGVANAPAGKRTGVGLLLHEQLSRELLDHATLEIVLDERVVLLGRAFSQRLEPVRIVRHAHLGGPLLDACGHGVGYRAVEPGPVVNDVCQFLVDVLGQVLVHFLPVEHIFPEVLIGPFSRCFHFQGLLLESLCNYLESEVVHRYYVFCVIR